MAGKKLPDALARRHLLEGELDASKAAAYADAYLEAGQEIDAIDFLAKAGDTGRLAALQDAAVERGDVFLMRAASRGLGDEPSVERWTELAEAARSAGRMRDAESAARLATVDG